MQVPYDANLVLGKKHPNTGGEVGATLWTGSGVGIPAPQPEPTVVDGISRCLLSLSPRLVRHSARLLNVECQPI